MSRIPVRHLAVALAAVVAAGATAGADAAPPPATVSWQTVVDNADVMPGSATGARFNSYNQPSVNQSGLVVFRARSKGGEGGGGCGGCGGESARAAATEGTTHGIYTRDLRSGGPIVKVIDRTSLVPEPNNRDAMFIETPAFPRIDLTSSTFVFRGNSQPVWRYGEDVEETAGTTGVYADVGGTLLTGASKLGGVPEFGFYGVPGLPATSFEVFPGAPSVTGSTIVFKGNYTESGIARTGVFYRELAPDPMGGTGPVEAIATSSSTLIPGTSTLFGSTSPPSAALGKVVFSGFDDETKPTLGGIYVAPVAAAPELSPVAEIGGSVPDRNGKRTSDTFNRLGESVSFDGRLVAFWGAWGSETRSVTVTCPSEGNKARQAFCLAQNGGNPQYEMQVPLHQGIFVSDTVAGTTRRVAQTGTTFRDFVYWAFTGKVEGSVEGDDGEPAAWRSSTYAAVSGGPGARFRVAFEATKSDGVTGLYLGAGPGSALQEPRPIIDTTVPGQTLDPAASPDSLVAALGLERDGFRGDWLVISAKLLVPGAKEETGMAGIYAARLASPPPPSGSQSHSSSPVPAVRDSQTPTAPAGLAGRIAHNALHLSWRASQDNVGVDHYDVYLAGSRIRRVPGGTTNLAFRAFRPHGSSVYTVRAVDAAGNRSAPGGEVTAEPVPRPKSAPRSIPSWAWKLLHPQDGIGVRPARPRPLPSWYAPWKKWRHGLFRLAA